MKLSFWNYAALGFLVLTLAWFAWSTVSGAAAAPAPVIVERGQNHRTWERTVTEVLGNGTTIERKSSVIELGTSMHYWKDGQWTESQARFRLFPGGAVADEAPSSLIIAPDLSQEPVVDLLAPGGRFQVSPRWLAYFDRATGQSAMVAAIKPCVGQLVAPNVIVFADAFDDVAAAIKLTYQPWGIESEVLLLESGPLRPQDYGLVDNGGNIVLEMWSEFHTWPAGGTAAASVEGGLPDVKLVFGQSQIGIGKAFSVGNEETTIAVGKTWTQVDQKQFLIEAVRHVDLAPLLANLPQQAAANNAAPRARAMARRQPVASRAALAKVGQASRLPPQKVPEAPPAQGRPEARPTLSFHERAAALRGEKSAETAAIQPASTRLGPAVSIDYSIVSSISDLRLKGDTTYLVTNSVTLSGTTTIEGGAVIKFSNVTNAGSNRLLITGPIDCLTKPGSPAIFTARDDDSVGEALSTGSLGTNRYAGRALELNAANTTYDLHDLRFRFPDKAAYISSSTATCLLSHVQVSYANIALNNQYTHAVARNLLVHDSLNLLSGAVGATSRFEHATLHRVGTFRNNGTVYLTNSILISVTNGVVWTGSNVETNLNDSGIFQTVGSGARYLASQSAYRNAGTTNINPTLLADLRQRTTYPPIVLTSDIVSDTTLYPQAGRDTDTPDLGYHPESLDYCWTGLTLSNATLRLAAGVAVAVYGTNGLRLENGSKFISEGAPTSLNRLLRYSAVQEEPGPWGATAGTMSLFLAVSTTTLPEVRLRFTDVSLLADAHAERHVIADLSAYVIGALEFKDSTLRGGFFDVRPTCASPSLTQTIGLTNTLFLRGLYDFTAAYSGDTTPVIVHLRNLLAKDCELHLNNRTNTTTWTAHDNFFDTVSLYGPDNSFGQLVNTHNGYLSTTTLPSASNTQTVPYADYQIGSLGSYYYPTNGTNLAILQGAGSRNADAAGLWHFTVTPDQVAETNSVVDIGMHFTVINSQVSTLTPLDSDSDSFANYFEDLDGDGVVDSSETDWNNSTDLGLRVVITRPQNGANIP
jgi:hypothetical protein